VTHWKGSPDTSSHAQSALAERMIEETHSNHWATVPIILIGTASSCTMVILELPSALTQKGESHAIETESPSTDETLPTENCRSEEA